MSHYRWVDADGDILTIEKFGAPDVDAMSIVVRDTWDEEVGEVFLPTDPAEVEKLVAAILNAADCRLERLVFPEDALKGMHGMTVVKR